MNFISQLNYVKRIVSQGGNYSVFFAPEKLWCSSVVIDSTQPVQAFLIESFIDLKDNQIMVAWRHNFSKIILSSNLSVVKGF
jgi:hypothetical protein